MKRSIIAMKKGLYYLADTQWCSCSSKKRRQGGNIEQQVGTIKKFTANSMKFFMKRRTSCFGTFILGIFSGTMKQNMLRKQMRSEY